MNWHPRFLQQAAWTQDLRAYAFDRTGLTQAERVLEVGCGTGAILTGLQTPAAIHGLDLNPGRLLEAHLHAPEARLTCGDAHWLPYKNGTFDITFCHFLLLWVRDPCRALLEMKRVTRPGGFVLALAEPDHSGRVDQPESLRELGRWQSEALQRQGADISIGSRLKDLFQQADLPPSEAGCLHAEAGSTLSREDLELEWRVLVADLAGMVPSKELRRLRRLDFQAWQQGGRVLYVPTYFAWSRVGQMV